MTYERVKPTGYLYPDISKDVRILGYFSKPEGCSRAKPLRITTIDNSKADLYTLITWLSPKWKIFAASQPYIFASELQKSFTSQIIQPTAACWLQVATVNLTCYRHIFLLVSDMFQRSSRMRSWPLINISWVNYARIEEILPLRSTWKKMWM